MDSHPLRNSVPLRWVLASVAGLVILRLGLAAALWDPGWNTLTWDDFTRVQIAEHWAAHPQVAPDLVWLPFSTWVQGSAFLVFGWLVRDNPLLLTAVLNTAALLLTSVIVGWSALRLSGSRIGALLAFIAMLFSPWGLFASLSGMAESLYYLAVAVVVLCTIGWLQTHRRSWLWAATAAVAVTAVSRYEGWTLMAAWMVVLAVVEVGWTRSGFVRRMRQSAAPLAIMAVPAVVPLWWMALNWSVKGSPLAFADEVARYFATAYGAVHGIIPRLTYYPLPLIRSAPLVVLTIATIIVMRRRDRLVITLTLIVGIHFGILYGSSIVSPVVGAAAIERFLFAFVVMLMPLLGYVPETLRSLRASRTVIVLLIGLSFVVTTIRILDPPLEWAHGPDLLTLATTLGDLGTSDAPLTVVVGPEFATESLPLSVRNGDRIRLEVTQDIPLSGPALGDRIVWVEKLPERVWHIDREPAAVIGRYRVYSDTPIPVAVCTGCGSWTLTDDLGVDHEITPGPFVALEFGPDDPAPGSRTSVSHIIPRTQGPQTAVLQLRSLYGHGFNPGRIEVEVRLDGQVVFSRDIAERSAWIDIPVPIEAGTGDAGLVVSVIALPGIETGWTWGRASTVLIRSLEIAER